MTKQTERPIKRNLERTAECQTESKTFAKFTMARRRAPGLDCERNLRLTMRGGKPDLQSVMALQNGVPGARNVRGATI